MVLAEKQSLVKSPLVRRWRHPAEHKAHAMNPRLDSEEPDLCTRAQQLRAQRVTQAGVASLGRGEKTKKKKNIEHHNDDVKDATTHIKASSVILSLAASCQTCEGQYNRVIVRHDTEIAFCHAAGSGTCVGVPAKGLAKPRIGWRALIAL